MNWQVSHDDKWIGTCNGNLLGIDEKTDARFRCPEFKRKPDDDAAP